PINYSFKKYPNINPDSFIIQNLIMKNQLLIIIPFLASSLAYSQSATNLLVTSPEVNNILKGNYTPGSYQASVIINNPDIVSSGLVNRISPDSLKSYLVPLKSCQNRNTGSDTVSSTRGI